MMQAASLTARLLGDPMPDRWARASALRHYHRVPDPIAAADAARDLRTQILDALKDGPAQIRALGERLSVEPAKIRNALQHLLAAGSVQRVGGGTGMISNLHWKLPGDERPIPPPRPRQPKGAAAISAVLPVLNVEGGRRQFEIVDALRMRRQRLSEILALAMAEGLVRRTGNTGCQFRYHLTAAGQAQVAS